jgi:hypothetical protein
MTDVMLTLSNILERLIEPDQGTFSPEHARYILSLTFSEAERDRCEELSYKAQDGALTSEEKYELELYLSANNLLILLKSKARQSLEQRPSAA